jgi:hypothetical protein
VRSEEGWDVTNRVPRTFSLGVLMLAFALPAGAQARPLKSPPRPRQYILVEFTTGVSTKLFMYPKSLTWELPEEHISGTYAKKHKGHQIEIVYVGEDPVSEEECDMTLLWPAHPKKEHVDPYGTERCYTRSGPLPAREVYVLGDE